MQQTCAQCNSSFTVTQEELDFHKRVAPSFDGKEYSIPPPTLCTECRLQRRLAHRNEKTLYRRICDKTGKEILSIHAPGKGYVIYETSERWEDSWDAKDSARDFDFSRPFFEQFAELQKEVPRMSLQQENNDNSDYTSNVSHLKDCYMLFSADFNRDCCYGVWIERSRDCIDNFNIDQCERAYECIFSSKLYACAFVSMSSNCSDSAFLLHCHGCRNCLMCWGMRNKQYCIANKQYSKEEYEQKLNEFPLSSHKNIVMYKKKFSELLATAPRPAMWKHGTVIDSTGDFLINCQHCINCYELNEAKDCTNSIGFQLKDALDVTYAMGELAYESCECFPTPTHSAFNINCYTGSDLYYCDMCMNNCQNCFGCVSLKHAQYCILNKQYTKEEYEELVPKIIKHMEVHSEWGEFFPIIISPFGYNESEAQRYYPLTQKQVLEQALRWQEEVKEYETPKKPVEIPDDIADMPDGICDQILTCEETGKPYKVIAQELRFYKEMGIPVPRRCPDQRHSDRMKMRNPRQLWQRKCDKCRKEMETNYAPDRPEKVYCESCYLKEVY